MKKIFNINKFWQKNVIRPARIFILALNKNLANSINIFLISGKQILPEKLFSLKGNFCFFFSKMFLTTNISIQARFKNFGFSNRAIYLFNR